MGWGLTPPSSSYINAKVRWLRMAVKNLYPLTFSELVFYVQVKFLLISWHFLVDSWLRHPPTTAHSLKPSFLLYLRYLASTYLGQVSFMPDL